MLVPTPIEELQSNIPLMALIQTLVYHLEFLRKLKIEASQFNFHYHYSSGLNSSQRRQALLEEVKTKNDWYWLKGASFNKFAHFILGKTSKLNVESLTASEQSSKDALEATRLGYN